MHCVRFAALRLSESEVDDQDHGADVDINKSGLSCFAFVASMELMGRGPYISFVTSAIPLPPMRFYDTRIRKVICHCSPCSASVVAL